MAQPGQTGELQGLLHPGLSVIIPIGQKAGGIGITPQAHHLFHTVVIAHRVLLGQHAHHPGKLAGLIGADVFAL